MSPAPVTPSSPHFPLVSSLRTALASVYKRDAARELVLKVVDFAATEKMKPEPPDGCPGMLLKVYTPAVFRFIRTYFGVDDSALIEELEGQNSFLESGSSGKSGSWFFYTGDGLTVIKTIRHDEALNLTRILPRLYDYLTSHNNSLIVPFFGLYRLKLKGAKQKMYLVTMPNINRNPGAEQRIYDLKGSTVGRTAKTGVGKDLDFLKEQNFIKIGQKDRTRLIRILKEDSDFLADVKLIDYSLLIMRDKMDSDGHTGGYLTPTDPCERMLFKHSAFRVNDEYDGSMRLCYRIEADRSAFRICIIDYLTGYSSKKAMERGFKSIAYDKQGVSAAPPEFYAERFYNFMETVFQAAGKKKKKEIEKEDSKK